MCCVLCLLVPRVLVFLGATCNNATSPSTTEYAYTTTSRRLQVFKLIGGITEGNCPELAETIKGWEADPMAVWGQLQRPVNAALEKVVTAQVLKACEEALAPLPPSMALAMKACKSDGDVTEEQERERAVARVLLGERHALEACVEYWKRMEEALAAE